MVGKISSLLFSFFYLVSFFASDFSEPDGVTSLSVTTMVR